MRTGSEMVEDDRDVSRHRGLEEVARAAGEARGTVPPLVASYPKMEFQYFASWAPDSSALDGQREGLLYLVEQGSESLTEAT